MLLAVSYDLTSGITQIVKDQRFQVEFSRVKKSEDLTEGFNCRGKGKLSDAALRYLRSLESSGDSLRFVSRRTLCC